MEQSKLKSTIESLMAEATGIIDHQILKLDPAISSQNSKRLVECIVSIALLEFTALMDAGRKGAEAKLEELKNDDTSLN